MGNRPHLAPILGIFLFKGLDLPFEAAFLHEVTGLYFKGNET